MARPLPVWPLAAAALAWLAWPRSSSARRAPSTAGGSMNFDRLAPEYRDRWRGAILLPSRRPVVEAIARALAASRNRYAAVADLLHIPWYVVAIIHQLEASGRWNAHLHNGDPLTARTTHVPVGRPTSGSPPFTWEASARDALRSVAAWHDWSVAGILYQLEKYNGFGYRSHNVPSPYLWSFTDQYERGKFTSDGHFDPDAVSAQAGGAAILAALIDQGLIETPTL